MVQTVPVSQVHTAVHGQGLCMAQLCPSSCYWVQMPRQYAQRILQLFGSKPAVLTVTVRALNKLQVLASGDLDVCMILNFFIISLSIGS
jgi:hypothetical protein